MLQTLLAAGIAPLLTAASTVAARRWGPALGGVVSAFPAIVGPVLLVLALSHGPAFAARAAEGTLLGLVGLAAFAVAYGRSARRRSWRVSLVAGWAAAAVASVAAGALGSQVGPPAGLLAAAVALAAAHRALPSAPAPTGTAAAAPPQTSIPLRMALTAALVVTLAAAAGALGPVAGGVLAALPVLASILSVLTHRETGATAVTALLRGMTAGMAGFVAFCEIVALLLTHTPPAATFAVATAGALLAQMPAARAA